MNAQLNAASDRSDAIYLLGFSPRTTDKIRGSVTSALPIVECRTEGNIDCWFVRVPRDQFDGEAAERNLADINWLSPRVMAHQRAVEYLSGELPFFPAHFGTLFTGTGPLMELVRANRRTLTEYFANEARHVEWGIKCFVAWPRAVDAYHRSINEEVSADTGAGLNYLRRKQMIRQRDQTIRQWLDRQLSETKLEIEKLSVGCRERQTNIGGDNGDWECVANLAVLLPRNRHTDLQLWMESKNAVQANEQGMLSFQLTGPWPLYSFVPALIHPQSCEATSDDAICSAA